VVLGELAQDFRALKDKLWQEGWFEPQTSFHWRVVAIAWTVLFSCLGLLHLAHWDFPPVVKALIVGLAGVCLAQFWQQSLLIAHDACHTGITRKRSVDSLIGQVAGTLCSGIGATWWTKDHNEHHAVTNQVEGDRGGDRTSGALPVMTVHELQLEENLKGKGPLPNGGKPLTGQQPWYWLLLKIQCLIYFPVMLIVARFNLHIISVVLATKDKRLALDVGLMAGFMYITWNICQLAPEGYRWGFYWTAHVTVSMLHMIIGMNHFHLPMFNEVPTPENGGWLKHQMATTSNISGGAFINWYCGGLQNQIEHHLFPQMPRSRLLKLKPMVQSLCKKHGVEYQEHGFFKSNVLVLDVMWRVTNSPLSQLTVSPGHFKAH
jgi:fatty acid desaturase